jgi:hypothetical protein
MHSRPAHYEEANFRHKAQSKDTTQSDMPNETTIPVVPFYRGMKIVNKPFISNNFSTKNDMNPRTHNDKQLVQYHNPHQRELNVLSKNRHNNEYNDDNDEHNDDYDEYNDDCYDIDEVFGGRNDSIEGHNPGYNVKNTLSSIDREMTNLPCYAELQGKCLSPNTCRYSHDIKLLQKTWSDESEELNKQI